MTDQAMGEGSSGRRGLPIAWLLALTLGGLVLLAAVPPVVLGYLGARDNTARLLRDRAELTLDAVIDPVSARLERMRDQLAYVAQAVLAGDIDPADDAAMRPFLLGALAATPQVSRISHVRPDRTVTFYDREGRETITETASDPGLLERFELDQTAATREQRWFGPVWSPTLLEPVVTLRQPLTADGAFAGTVVAAVTVRSLAREVGDAAAGLDATPFILLGEDRVLAHPLLAAGPWRRPADGDLLPKLEEVGDLTLAAIWTERNPLSSNAPFRNAKGHWNLGPEGYTTFTYRKVDGFGDRPWLFGVHYPAALTRRERWIVLGIGLAGVLLLVLALAIAVRIAGRLSRPILELADAACRIERLDFSAPVAYRPGLIAEVNAARRAFARMGQVLARTQVYLPRRLIQRLLTAGADAGASELREVTVMFCDLEGFTAFARGRPAGEVTDYVNGLMRRLGPAIEATGGTIDKYTGDGVMAFWGAPEHQPDHAARALAAVREIGVEVVTFNASRRARGLPACRLRVGLHAGPAIVGNVGFEGRVDYTAMGEAVNAAQRLEQRGRGLSTLGEEVVVVASAAALEAAAPDASARAEPLEPRPGLPPACCLHFSAEARAPA
ncbi:MAG TPA: adenylate/guanylate cyclase domain-containing protein [Geminicoccaceae bacterium]|nr:adenylate/guanylate cyclase domain-containing protein [Geminicoccaceae bacterium]